MLAAVANTPKIFALSYDLWIKKELPFRKKCPTCKTFNKLHYKENVFFSVKKLKEYVILLIVASKIPLTFRATVDYSFRFVPRV